MTLSIDRGSLQVGAFDFTMIVPRWISILFGFRIWVNVCSSSFSCLNGCGRALGIGVPV